MRNKLALFLALLAIIGAAILPVIPVMGATTFLVPKNNAGSTLGEDYTTGRTWFTVADNSTFPTTYPFEVSVDNEIFKVTSQVSDNFTVVYAQEGTTNATHTAGTNVQLLITAKYFTDLDTAVNALENAGYIPASTFTANNDFIIGSGSGTYAKQTLAQTQTILGVGTRLLPYGGGNDGVASFDNTTTVLGIAPSSSTYTLTRDIYCTSITISSGVTVKTAGYRVFCTGTLTVNGYMNNDGGNAGNGGNASSGTGGTGGTAGAAVPAPTGGLGHTAIAGVVGATGGSPGGAAGGFGTTSSFAYSAASNGVAGGAGGGGSGGAAGAGGTTTAADTSYSYRVFPDCLRCWYLSASVTPTYTKYGTSASGGSGGAGSGGGTGASGGGGGSGAPGGILVVCAPTIVGGNLISCKGGTGGNGGSPYDNGSQNVTGSGAGAGGNGGLLIVICNSIDSTPVVTGGAHGTGSSGVHGGASGGNGNSGNAGELVLIMN